MSSFQTDLLVLNSALLSVTGSTLYFNGAAASAGPSVSPGGFSGAVQYNANNGTFSGADNVFINDGDFMLVLEPSGRPSLPPAGNVKLFGRSVGGGMLPAFVGPAGVDSALQPFLARNKVAYWDPIGNVATLPLAFGLAAPVASGTATARNVLTTNLFTSMKRLGYVSIATSGACTSISPGAAQFWRGNAAGLGGFRYVCRFGMSDAGAVANARSFVGLYSGTATTSLKGQENMTGWFNLVGVGNDAGDAHYQIINNDGAGNIVKTDLGSQFPTTGRSTQPMELALFAPSNASYIGYQVTMLNPDIAVTGQLTADIPSNTTLLAPWMWRSNGGTASAVGMDLMSLYVETDY